jgi:predicted O-methyltransferase YrrM
VGLDVQYGNMTEGAAFRLARAARRADGVPHEPGSTEPWVSRLVADFIIARGARTVLETGCFKGATSVWIAQALSDLGGGDFYMCDIDRARESESYVRVSKMDLVDMTIHQIVGDILQFLAVCPDRFDLAWVDDCHEKSHVTKELMLLMPKMNPGGLILLHDVFGVCDLKTVVQQFGGYSIDLPRLGPAGGLGIIQC